MSHPAPLFILAPPRSFTSVLNGVIGQHPDILGMPELNLFQAETMQEFMTGIRGDGSRRSPFWHLMRHDGVLRAVAQLYAGEQTMDAVDMARRWLLARGDRATGEVYRELCERVSPRIMLDKSPAYARRRDYLDRIVESFPNARFIHLVRHPRGQCESILKAEGGQLVAFFMGAVADVDGRPVIDPQKLWLEAQRVITDFLLTLPVDRWRRVVGEEFMADIQGGAKELCAWLDLDADEKAIEAMTHPERSPFASLGPANARLGNDPNFLEQPALRPSNVKPQSLEGPLSWRPDGADFMPEVRRVAEAFGYH
ncbi:MAG: sulfotransferase [Pseudomonadota bacterium]